MTDLDLDLDLDALESHGEDYRVKLPVWGSGGLDAAKRGGR